MIGRAASGADATGARATRLIWAKGIGGMGKSWFLHRVRCRAEAAHPKVRSLVVDWDKPEWLAPLRGEPKVAEDVFDLLAIRLSQRLGVEAADPYWLAKARVKAAAEAHKVVADRFEGHLQLAFAGGSPRVESHLFQLLRDDNLWHDDEDRRRRNVDGCRQDHARYRELLAAWCRRTGETNPAVVCPDRELADGLRDALRSAAGEHPLVLLLDTCEVLSTDLDAWLRTLLTPLLREPVPFLVLIGSRLRPDAHQPLGSKWGWLPEVARGAWRVEDFGELLRFTVGEIEAALEKLSRPVVGEPAGLAETLHRVTLGLPLAVRTLLDLHEAGDDVFSGLTAPDEDDRPLSERDAVREVIATVSNRLLLNLEGRVEREDDLRDIIALALLPGIDPETLRQLWHPTPVKRRLVALAGRYSLLSDGDLHPTVRVYLRKHWRDENNRPAVFDDVLTRLEGIFAAAPPEPPADAGQRVARLAAELNLRSWREGDAVVDDLARARCLARAHDADGTLLEGLLAELPLAGPGLVMARKLWHRDDNERPDDAAVVPWLQWQCSRSAKWADEDKGGLALVGGIASADRFNKPADALAALAQLDAALAYFGLDQLPRSDTAGKAFFECGYALDPQTAGSANWAADAASAYERAVALSLS